MRTAGWAGAGSALEGDESWGLSLQPGASWIYCSARVCTGLWHLEGTHHPHHRVLVPFPGGPFHQSKNKSRHQEDPVVAEITLPMQKMPWDCAESLPLYAKTGEPVSPSGGDPNFRGAAFALQVTGVLAVITVRSAYGSGTSWVVGGEGLISAPCSIICCVLLCCLFASPSTLNSRTTPLPGAAPAHCLKFCQAQSAARTSLIPAWGYWGGRGLVLDKFCIQRGRDSSLLAPPCFY